MLPRLFLLMQTSYLKELKISLAVTKKLDMLKDFIHSLNNYVLEYGNASV